MRGLENSVPCLVVYISARCYPDAADLSRERVRDIVPIQVERRYHIIFLRLYEDILQECIADIVLYLDAAPLSGYHDLAIPLLCPVFLSRRLIAPCAEAAFGELHDVALMDQGDASPAVFDRIIDRGADKALRAIWGDWLYADGACLGKTYLAHSHHGGEEIDDTADLIASGWPFDAGIYILGVLPEYDHIDKLRVPYR